MATFVTALLLAAQLVSAAPALDSVVKCLSSANVPQDVPGSAAFSRDIIPYNLRLSFTPSAFAVPTTVPQIQKAVSCAAKYGVKVNPKSGGHSYAAHSLGGEDGHLVIDLKNFKEISVNSATKVATVGPGTRLGNLALGLYSQGKRAIAHGVCPGVGVGGHVLHGGQGYSSHSHGLAVDFIESAEVVLADSSVVTASATSNPDLFWAIRGAGFNLGVITSFKFRTIAAPEDNVLFYYPYVWSRAQAGPGWTAFQEYTAGRTTPQIPIGLNIRFVIVKDSGDNLLFLLEGAYHGSEADYLATIQPLLDSLNAVGGLVEADVVVKTVGWLDSLLYANSNALFRNWDNGEKLEVPFNYTAHATFYAKSLMTNDLSPAGVDAWITRLYDTGPTNSRNWYFIVAAQGGPTSVVPLVPNNATAYAHRDQIFEWQLVDAVAPPTTFPDAEGIAWLTPFITDIQAAEAAQGKTLGMYYNYADPALSKSEADQFYWLDNLARLEKVKQKFDPKRVFENPQTV
ncbi:hypothetical protein B0O99DRAFT_572502 [Bisporella sp. PMI_857]|nr:hypothetical protein B0O99DRAFT_572502 [Bisporella sp. PMI_857]